VESLPYKPSPNSRKLSRLADAVGQPNPAQPSQTQPGGAGGKLTKSKKECAVGTPAGVRLELAGI
jgi:hypothetical protein